MTNTTTLGTGSSIAVKNCQICSSDELEQVVFLGYLPPVNQMRTIGDTPEEQPSYPAMMLLCRKCSLAQLGCIVDPQILFPPEYPYTSGTTKILRENFAEMYEEASAMLPLSREDLVVDIGSNDGTLLSNWVKNHRVLGVEPSERGNLANERGIETWIRFFTGEAARSVRSEKGPAKVVTATNVFAHMEDVHSIVDGIVHMLADDGVFISESHYVVPLIETLQYDTIYHEHMRYYSLTSLKYLLDMHGLEIFHAKRIPTHGGSIRVYAARPGTREVRDTVAAILEDETRHALTPEALSRFRRRIVGSKLALQALLRDVKNESKRVFGVGAPSRASTLINHVGLDDGILDCVVEVKDSFKVGKYIPGTIIPVVDESRLFEEKPDYALLLSWHIADELMPKLKAKGFGGDFIVPLPEPHVVRSEDVK
jgi:hypothetical protein